MILTGWRVRGGNSHQFAGLLRLVTIFKNRVEIRRIRLVAAGSAGVFRGAMSFGVVDRVSQGLMSGAGPRGPNAARALCKERLHD